MNFIDYLESRFSADSRNTEMYKLIASFGTYAEATISQEARALIDRNVDPSKMLADDIRKYLSYFYIPVRNYIAASGTVSVTILKATASVAFSPGDTLLADNGSIYVLTSSAIGYQGDVVSLLVRQSSSNTVSGNYDNYIVLPSDNIVMSSLQLVVNNKIINQVSTPRNGFMAFLFGGNVYVKVFPGIDVPRLRGQAYSLSFYTCDGVAGNVEANTFSAFTSQTLDANLKAVDYSIANAAIENGASTPSVGELRDLLRFWLYTRNTLTKTSDYKRWYLTQPEVGDCLVWGDTEEFMRNGPPLSITGKVRVCLLSAAGAEVSAATKLVLDTRIQPVKDIAYLEYQAPTFTSHYFEVKFSGSLDDDAFSSYVLREIAARYDLPTLRAVNMSLFDALDVGVLTYVLGRHETSPTGLEIIPYFYHKHTFATQLTSYTGSVDSPNNLKKGYTKYHHSAITDGIVVDEEWFTEYMTGIDTASIVRSNGSQIGTHNYSTNTITLAGYNMAPGTLEVMAEALNRSILDTGGFTVARLLGGVAFIKVSELAYA